jgi:hypothetical protein
MYIQKIKTPRKGIQLGVYLHRHSMPDLSASPSAQTPSTPSKTSPDDTYTQQLSTKSGHEKSFSRYADKRKTVRTWFKIFCPARGPSHGLTQFQSSPDNFALMQSWVSSEEKEVKGFGLGLGK